MTLRHQSLNWTLVIAIVLLGGHQSTWAVDTFKMRARVTKFQGKPPTDKTFTYHYRGGLWGAHYPAKVSSTGSEWSDWLPFDQDLYQKSRAASINRRNRGNPLVLMFYVDGAEDTTVVEAELKFDADSDKTFNLPGELFGPRFGILIYREDDQPKAATMAQYNRRYWKHFDTVEVAESERPKQFAVIDTFVGGSDNNRITWREGIENLRRAGSSVIMVPPGVSGPLGEEGEAVGGRVVREIALSAGVRRTGGATFKPPGWVVNYDIGATGDDNDPDQLVDDWAQKWAKSFRDAGHNTKDVVHLNILDEPGWHIPAQFEALTKNAKAMDRFRDFLKSQELKPADVRAASWDEVQPIGRGSVKDIASRRLFYWTSRFLAWDSSRHLSNVTKLLEKAFYPGIGIGVNWNNFKGRFYVPQDNGDKAVMHHDWLEFGRMRGCTTLWIEDWFDDNMGPHWSYYCARLRSGARKGGVGFGGYIIGRAGGNREDGITMKALTIAGMGGKTVQYYNFGPEYNFPGNCYSYKSASVLPAIAKANRMIGKAEDVLWPGKPPRPQVAILFPQSAQVWDPPGIVDATNVLIYMKTMAYMAEVYSQYMVLQRANIPVDFVEELDLTPEGLKPYRLLYVTSPIIPVEYQRGLADWVQSGGTLVTVTGAATRDRYAQPTDVFSSLIGIQEEPRNRFFVPQRISQLDVLEEGKGKEGEFVVAGVRGKVTRRRGKILATFNDRSPAIIEQTHGRGKILHFAFFPAMSYQGKTDHGEKMWGWMTYPTRIANVEPPVKVDLQPGGRSVEAPLLLSEAGAAVTLLNWDPRDDREPLDNLNVSVRLPFKAESVASVTHGDVEFKQTEQEVTFGVPLKHVDIIVIKPARGLAAKPESPPPRELLFRTWTTADGKYTVEAKLIKSDGDFIHLQRKDNGKQIKVPAAKLSQKDRDYIKSTE